MKTVVLAIVLSLCTCSSSFADTFGTGMNQFEIEFVEIDDPGNAVDTTRIFPRAYPNPLGAVDYVYNLSKHEISREMVEKAEAEGYLLLTLDDMDFVTGGPRPKMPATGLSWNEAARFVNWLNTSQGFPPAYNFSTRPDDFVYAVNEDIDLWEADEPGFDPSNPFRNSQSKYFLPSADEWYKAAFYAPNSNGNYWDYHTGSDVAPTPVASGTGADTVVYGQPKEQGPADIAQAGGLSAYGVMGLLGNVWEWQETKFNLENDNGSQFRLAVSGGWGNNKDDMLFTGDAYVVPDISLWWLGFRVASIDQPPPIDPLADCTGDGALTAADLACVTTIGPRDDVLQALNTLPGDLDGNGDVSFGDFLVLSQNFGQAQASYAEGNINLTDGVDFADFLVLSSNFGKIAETSASVPEPTTTAMMCAAIVGIVSLRRRHRVGIVIIKERIPISMRGY